MTLPGEVPLVGKGRANVVEFSGTITVTEAETVPLLVGNGVISVEDGSGVPVGVGVTSVGATSVVELTEMAMPVEVAVPFTELVVTVIIGEDSAGAPVALPVGSEGVTSGVVELANDEVNE